MEIPSCLPRFFPSVVLVLGLSLSAEAAPRTFTSPDGHTVQAEIQSATKDSVTLKLAAGPVMTVPISQFSQADQTYVAQWRRANWGNIKYGFAVSYTERKTDSRRSTLDGVELTTESWICDVNIINRSGQPLGDLKVEYDIYYDQVNGSDPIVEKATGSKSVGSLDHLQEFSFQTIKVKPVTSKSKIERDTSKDSRPKKKDAIKGLCIRFFHEEILVLTWFTGEHDPAARAVAP